MTLSLPIRATWLLAATAIVVSGCTEENRPPEPSFDPVFPALTGELMTISSPRAVDLSGDGVLDIVFGTGVARVQPRDGRFVFTDEPAISGYVIAVSGATNEILWQVPNPRDAFTTPRFARLNGDSITDVITGGREGALSAFSGIDGKLLWRVNPADVARTPVLYNFFTPALIRDANADGVSDLVVIYGGDDTRPPKTARNPSYVAVISGADGAVLKSYAVPDAKESYSAVVVYERPDGREWFIFGTGGETHGGAAYRAPVGSLTDGSFPQRAERLIAPGPAKGTIAPPTLLDLTGDGELDIVISTFDGRLIAIEGASGKTLWERRDENEESYHPAAVVRIAADGKPGLFVSRGIGAFPKYTGSVHRLHDAADGKVLYEYKDPFYPAGAPLAVDLDNDGVDEPFFFSVRYPSGEGARIYMLHTSSSKLIAHDVATNYWSTPLIAAVRGTAGLELIGLSWRQKQNAPPDWRGVEWQLLRLDLNAKAPAFMSWAAYMGTRSDGHYRRE